MLGYQLTTASWITQITSLARLIHLVFHDLVLSDLREFLFVLIDETGSRY